MTKQLLFPDDYRDTIKSIYKGCEREGSEACLSIPADLRIRINVS